MPSIEFVGYSREQALGRVKRYREIFSDSVYSSDFLFIVREDSIAVNLQGKPEPHVIVKSRFQERLDQTVEIIRRLESAEFPNFIGVESFLVRFDQAVVG